MPPYPGTPFLYTWPFPQHLWCTRSKFSFDGPHQSAEGTEPSAKTCCDHALVPLTPAVGIQVVIACLLNGSVDVSKLRLTGKPSRPTHHSRTSSLSSELEMPLASGLLRTPSHSSSLGPYDLDGLDLGPVDSSKASSRSVNVNAMSPREVPPPPPPMFEAWPTAIHTILKCLHSTATITSGTILHLPWAPGGDCSPPLLGTHARFCGPCTAQSTRNLNRWAMGMPSAVVLQLWLARHPQYLCHSAPGNRWAQSGAGCCMKTQQAASSMSPAVAERALIALLIIQGEMS